jgi:hypothetical protein
LPPDLLKENRIGFFEENVNILYVPEMAQYSKFLLSSLQTTPKKARLAIVNFNAKMGEKMGCWLKRYSVVKEHKNG